MPLFMLPIAVLTLGERGLWQQMVCSGASLLEALVIARPVDLLLGTGESRISGVIAALITVLGTSICTVLVRKLHRISPTQTVASNAVWSVVVGSIVVVVFQENYDYLTTEFLWIIVFLIAVFGFGFTWLQSLALQLEPASYMINFRYRQLIWSIVWDLGLWRDLPDAWSVVGTCFVLASAAISIR